MHRLVSVPVRALAIVLALVALFAACGGGDDATSADLEFTEVWTRQPVAGQTTSAVYGIVSNSGDSDVRITGAATDVTERVELHISEMQDDGTMTMSEVPEGFVVPAGGTFTFEPGGPHVMLFDIDPETYPTDAVDVTFEFDAGDDTFVTAEVRAVSGGMGDSMDDDSMDDDHGDMGDSMEDDSMGDDSMGETESDG